MRFLLILFLLTTNAAYSDDRFSQVKIETIKLTDNIYMLVGAGGNIGVLSGDDGLLMIDDQFAPLADRIKSALSAINEKNPTYLLNTHYHGDHTGGNHLFSENSIIMAHHNVRVRLVSEEASSAALPVITYEKAAHLYFNGEEINLIHLPSGHTDGDTVVHFTQSNVIHLGDQFFNGRFPYVDLGAGGSIGGLIKNIEYILGMIDNDTKIIPGHGVLGNKMDLEAYLVMLEKTSAVVIKAINAGKSLDVIIKEGLDKKWENWGTGYINEENWIKTLHAEYR